MAYRILGADQQRAERVVEGIKPTVLIGLGGTGGDVLLKVRKKVFERYGRSEDFPVLQYVYIDTDTKDQHIDSTLLHEFTFTTGERIDAVVQQTAKYTRHMSQYPLLKAWWYPSMHDFGSMVAGAGQIRGYSRLGFFVNFFEIRSAIENALTAATASADVMLKRWGVQVDTAHGPNVYIVASLAGGTGSGMFLDAAFLCKSLGIESTVGFLVLPGIFIKNQDRIFANGYAALKELEHFTYPENPFPYEWATGYPSRGQRPLPAPPFKYCYLVDSTNLDGKTVEFSTRHTLFEMIANSIYQDFGSSDFADQKRSARINLDYHLVKYYAAEIKDPRDPNQSLLQEVFTTHQSAFGLATIQYPADRIKRALGAQLARDIMRRLAQGEAAKGQFGEWVRETFFKGGFEQTRFKLFIGDVMLPSGQLTRRHNIFDSLYKTAQPGKTIPGLVEERVSQLQNDINNESYIAYRMTRSQFLNSQIEQIVVNLTDQPSNKPEQWGDWCKYLRQNKEEFLTEHVFGSTNALGEHRASSLQHAVGIFVNKPNMGITYARAVLREIRTSLTHPAYRYLPLLRRESEELAAEVQRQQKAFKEDLGELQRRETEGGIAARLFGRADREQLTANFLKAFRAYLLAAVKLRARREAIEICETILTAIGEEGIIEEKTGRRVNQSGMMRSLDELEISLNGLARMFDDIRDEYSKKGDDQNTLYVYDPSDLDDNYYPKYLGATLEARLEKISFHAQRLLDNLPSLANPQERGVKVMDLPQFVGLHGKEQAGKLMLQYCDAVFRTLHDDFQALDMFYAKYSDAERAQQLALIYSKAQVWIKPSGNTDFPLGTDKREFFVGVYKNELDMGNYRQFEKDIKTRVRKPGHPEPIFYDTPRKNEIVFYSEAAGYPLCFSQAAHDMRPKYEALAYDQFANLHADRNEYKFKDILEMTETERDELEVATRTFLLSVILGIVEVTQDTEDSADLIFTVREKIGTSIKERSIGTQHRATHVLQRSHALRNGIDALIRERQDELLRDGEGWAKYYAVVSYYEHRIFPPRKTERVSREHQFQVTTENLVLRSKIRAIENAAPDAVALQTKGDEYAANLENAAADLAGGFKAVRHAWAKPAIIRI